MSDPSVDGGSPETPSGTPEEPSPETPDSPVCTAGSYDHDDEPSTPCLELTECAAGQYVADEGSSTTDRSCVGCAPGTYSQGSNASGCDPWTSCGWTELETQAPSASTDRICGPGSVYRALPPSAGAASVAVDSQDDVLVGGNDGLVRVYDSNGTELGTIGNRLNGDTAASVAVDSQDDVLVASGRYDSELLFVSKYDRDGNQLWSEQVEDSPAAPLKETFVAVDGGGNVLVAGSHQLTPFVSKYDPDGNPMWNDRFDSGPAAFARAVAVDGEGNVLVAGYANGKLPGVDTEVPGYLFVRKYDSDGNRLWLEQFGNDVGFEEGFALAVDSEGNAYAGGFTLSGQDVGVHAILRKYDPDGNPLWTQQFPAAHDYPGVRALAVDDQNDVLVAFNADALGDDDTAGAVVRKVDPDGNEQWAWFESADADPELTYGAKGIAVDSRGRAFVAGYATPGSGLVWLVPEP